MKSFRQSLDFFVYSNLFMAVIAVLLTEQSFFFLTRHPLSPSLVGFVFSATLCSYSFHWWLTTPGETTSPRLVWLEKNRMVHLVFFLLSLATSLYYFIPLREQALWIGLAFIATFLYTAPKIPYPFLRVLRKAAIGKTIFLAAVWTWVTTVLPVKVSGEAWTRETTLFFISRYFFIYAICILFDFRDREYDRQAGIRSLITWFNERQIRILFIFSLLVSALASALLIAFNGSLPGFLSLVLPLLPLGFLYRKATRDYSDFFYYFVLDGLMALPPLLSLFARI